AIQDARMKHLLPFALGLLLPHLAVGQPVSLQDNALQDWSRLKDTMIKIAAAMPEDKFGYRATPAERTWGEQILHIAEANIVQIGRLDSKVPQTDQSLLAQAGSTRFDRFMGASTKARVVYYVIGHTWDIYGQMVVYLRLNGITPPTSQRF